MYDYKMAIEERFDELLEKFEEENGRKPTKDEWFALYEEAKDATDSRLAAWGDYLRKQEKGE